MHVGFAALRPAAYLVLDALDAGLEAADVERRHEVDEVELREDGRRVRQRGLLDLRCEWTGRTGRTGRKERKE